MRHLPAIVVATVEACKAFETEHGRVVEDPHEDLDYWQIMERAKVLEAIDDLTRYFGHA